MRLWNVLEEKGTYSNDINNAENKNDYFAPILTIHRKTLNNGFMIIRRRKYEKCITHFPPTPKPIHAISAHNATKLGAPPAAIPNIPYAD